MSESLAVIRAKEREVAERLEAARAEAAAQLARARVEASSLVAEARLRGERAADERYATGLARARSEAELLRTKASALTQAFRDSAAPRLPVAIERLVAFVLPDQGRG